MANNALPLLLAAGAAVILLGGKKKEKRPASKAEPMPEPQQEQMMPEPDPGQPPMVGQVVPERVAWGMRRDKRGVHGWRIIREGGGYVAQTLISDHRWAGVQENIGVANSENSARAILRDYYNDALLERYPNEKPKDDPHSVARLSL